MATINQIIAELAKEDAKKYEVTIETVTPTQGANTTQFVCGLDSEIDFVDKESNDAKTNVLFTTNINLNIACGKIATLAPFAGVIRNDKTGNLVSLLLGGAKVVLYQERLEAGVPYTDRYTGKEYTPQTDQYYTYITDVKVADPAILGEIRRMMLTAAIGAAL